MDWSKSRLCETLLKIEVKPKEQGNTIRLIEIQCKIENIEKVVEKADQKKDYGPILRVEWVGG